MTHFLALLLFPIIPENNNIAFPSTKFRNGNFHSRSQKLGISIPIPKRWEFFYHSRSQNLGMGWAIFVPKTPKVIPPHPCCPQTVCCQKLNEKKLAKTQRIVTVKMPMAAKLKPNASSVMISSKYRGDSHEGQTPQKQKIKNNYYNFKKNLIVVKSFHL